MRLLKKIWLGIYKLLRNDDFIWSFPLVALAIWFYMSKSIWVALLFGIWGAVVICNANEE